MRFTHFFFYITLSPSSLLVSFVFVCCCYYVLLLCFVSASRSDAFVVRANGFYNQRRGDESVLPYKTIVVFRHFILLNFRISYRHTHMNCLSVLQYFVLVMFAILFVYAFLIVKTVTMYSDRVTSMSLAYICIK